jgi:hypothetical protein
MKRQRSGVDSGDWIPALQILVTTVGLELTSNRYPCQYWSFLFPVTPAARRSMRNMFSTTARAFRRRAIRALVPMVAVSALVAAGDAQSSGHGYFRATARTNSDWIRLAFTNRPDGDVENGAMLSDVARNELAGVSADQLSSGSTAPVHFTLVREAGTVSFDGAVRDGEIDGTYQFTGDPRFSAALERAGYARPSEAHRFRLALTGVSMALVNEIETLGYVHPTTAELVLVGTRGVDIAYLRSMAPLADRIGNVATLAQLREHGVDMQFVADMERLGYANLSIDALMKLRDLGVDSVYISELADAGFIHIPVDEVVRAREHGVNAQYAREMRRAGYDHLSLDELGKLKDHDITAAFAEQIKRTASAGRPTADDLLRAKSRGVS